MAIINPSQYGIIDFHAWHALYDEKKASFSVEDYLKYLNDIRRKALEERVSAREIDKGLLIKDTGMTERIINSQKK